MTDIQTKDLVQEIKDRTKGLLYFSESEYPVQVYCCDTDEPMEQQLLRLSGRGQNEKIEETSLSFLFRNQNTLKGTQDHSEEENAIRYQKLLNFLTENLQNIKVYTVGEGQVDVFVTGSLENGTFITLATKSIEQHLES